MRQFNRGVTLIEAVIVMAVMTTCIVIVPPIFQWLGQQGVGHAVDQLEADLQLARVMAISRQTTCAVAFGGPADNAYVNLLDGRRVDLAIYRGGVHFLRKGPDGKEMTDRVDFNLQGMTSSVAPADIFISSGDKTRIYRLRILFPGGITRYRWHAGRWH